ncbi:MAG: ACT domain-containing protein [Candidatus Helarchaeota archaeon]
MKFSDIVRIDERFRIVIPKSIRESLGLVQGMYLLINSDTDIKEIRIIPFTAPNAKTINITITMEDFPGSLAKIASTLADLKIDLLLGESRIIQRKKIAQWFIIADITNCRENLEHIKEKLIKKGGAANVEFGKSI